MSWPGEFSALAGSTLISSLFTWSITNTNYVESSGRTDNRTIRFWNFGVDFVRRRGSTLCQNHGMTIKDAFLPISWAITPGILLTTERN